MNTIIMLPETSDPRWRRVLLDKNIPKFSSLTTQLMYSRVKMTLQMDSSPSAVLAASKMVYDYFTKNASKVQPDLESLVNEMEKVNV